MVELDVGDLRKPLSGKLLLRTDARSRKAHTRALFRKRNQFRH
jgi:hypothetical protein